ncbi:MAG TPA: hypothetical protein PLH91_11800, partial [Tenuifilaceae bacterium]|nr:hypothetical protein [Tenuifilaceae bacterium]
VRLKVFGQSVYDTLVKPTTLGERFGNSLHLTTSRKVIANNLLFKEGDVVKPVDFSETEELLRTLPYIEDVNIMLETLVDTNKVRAIVVTKDNWTLAFSFSSSSLDKGEYSISESNFAGIGFGADATAYYDKSHPDKWGRRGEFKFSNIGGSFITANLWMREGLGYNSYYTNLSRDFYASKAKLAGGITYFVSKEPYTTFKTNLTFPIDYNMLDWWLGHSFRVSKKSSLDAPYNLTLAFKHRKIDFNKAIEIESDSNFYFHSTNQWLVSLGLTNQSLFQSNLIYSFGSTEDIPIGFKVQFSSGIEKSQFSRRILINGEMSAAEITPIGYLYLSFRTGGYLADGFKFEQGVINIRSKYISNLFSVWRTDIRQLIQYDYTRGISRFSGEREYVALKDNYGVRGLSSNSLTGETRIMLNLETNVFTPLYLYGFRFAYFLFCDLGIIGPANELVYTNPIYSGFGFGIRFKNESLIFPAFVVRLGYYPRIPDNADVAYWLISTERRRRFENFRIKEPYILPYE